MNRNTHVDNYVTDQNQLLPVILHIISLFQTLLHQKHTVTREVTYVTQAQ